MTEYNFQADISKFDVDAIGYHGENSLFLADCAKLAYEPEAVIKPLMLEQLNFDEFKFFDRKINKYSTQAFVASNNKMIIVAFRGTEANVNDFLTDAKLRLEDGPAGKVHRGFRAALAEVWGGNSGDNDIHKFINKCRDNNQPIWFCGHSLGAALATLAAANYVLNGDDGDAKDVSGIYTIGQPRVGNSTFAKAFDAVLGEKCFRVVNNNDAVTRVPLPGIFLKYTHVGQERYIDSNGKLRKSVSRWEKIWDRLRGAQQDLGERGLDALKDHGSEGYVTLLKENRLVMSAS